MAPNARINAQIQALLASSTDARLIGIRAVTHHGILNVTTSARHCAVRHHCPDNPPRVNVWDMCTYLREREAGRPKRDANALSWHSIDVNRVLSVRAGGVEYNFRPHTPMR